VLTVLPAAAEDGEGGETPAHVARFLAACQRALAARGVVASTRVRRGPLLREIRAEIAEGGHDLVVVGAPLGEGPRHAEGFAGLVERLLRQPPPCPLLVVRGQQGA
jgi:nucleotide-binding universal stress UspA family protein